MFGWLIPTAFGGLLVAAAVMDFLQHRIANWIVAAIVALFVVQAARHFDEVSWINQLGAGAALLVAGLVLFSLGHLGAGDAKLLAAVALWAGLPALLTLLFVTSVAGLVVLGVLVAARRLVAWRGWQDKVPKSLIQGEGVPFGIAIAIGAIVTMPLFPEWLWKI